MGRRKAGVGQKLTFAFGLSSSFSGSNPEETIDTHGQLVESELIASSREIFAIPFARSSATSTATPSPRKSPGGRPEKRNSSQ